MTHKEAQDFIVDDDFNEYIFHTHPVIGHSRDQMEFARKNNSELPGVDLLTPVAIGIGQ